MAKIKAGTPAVLIDTEAGEICFFRAGAEGGVTVESETLSAVPFSEEFFERLSHILGFRRDAAIAAEGKRGGSEEVVLLLPDNLFTTDSVSIPLVKRGLINSSLLLAINELYKNSEELKFSSYPISQTKQNMTFGLLAIRRDLLSRTVEAFREHGFAVTAVLPQSHAAVDGVQALGAPLRGGTFVLADMGEGRTLFSLVLRGRCIATYSLPVGSSSLSSDAVNGEECLFDHTAAAALVARAKAAARSRRHPDDTPIHEEEGGGDSPMHEEERATEAAPAFAVRRSVRRLPAFMLRPIPEAREGVLYENFRHFVKWALELVRANARNLHGEKISTVYVHMPKEYSFLYDMANSEGEGGIVFAPIPAEDVPARLDAYGAVFGRGFTKPNNF